MQVALGATVRIRLPTGLARLGLLVAALSAGLVVVSRLAGAEAEAPAASRVGDPAPDPLRAWLGESDLMSRAERARLAALQVGVPSFDAPARGLLLEPGDGGRLERARAAAAAAPGLPLAQAALAFALLREEHDVPGAFGALLRALETLTQHREARLWLEATGLLVLRNALFFGALAFLVALAALHAPAAAHDLGDRLGRALPSFARFAILGVLVLLPSILGQGLMGLALACFALALCYGNVAERRAAWVAAMTLLVGLSLGSFGAARALVALDSDPVAAAFQLVERGVPSQSEQVRFEYAAGTDPLAARGLALLARRQGRLPEAAQRYESLLAAGGADATLANDAANVWIALGDAERAVTLFELASQLGASPVVLYNLSYGYGQAIRPRAQDETLQLLQREDPGLAFDLTQLLAKIAGGFTLDLPVPLEVFRERAERGDAVANVASGLRRELAPGVLGEALLPTALAFLASAFLARAASTRFRRSAACHRCGVRLCPRCDGAASARDLCGACRRLFERPETTDPERRSRRLAELDRRARWLQRGLLAASLLLPGAAGLLARRPWLGLVGAMAFCGAVASAASRLTRISDPLAAGGAGALAFGAAGILCLGLYLGFVVLALRPRVEARS